MTIELVIIGGAAWALLILLLVIAVLEDRGSWPSRLQCGTMFMLGLILLGGEPLRSVAVGVVAVAVCLLSGVYPVANFVAAAVMMAGLGAWALRLHAF